MNPPPPPLHPVAVGYIRVSTFEQASEGVSLDAQRARITAWASSNGYALAAIHEDAGLSGKTVSRRPGLQAALEDACHRGAALITTSLSRLSRSTRDAIDLAERLEAAGADLVSVSDNIDSSTATGKLMFRMLAVFAEHERDVLVERTIAGLDELRRQGKRTGGIPYGSTLGPDGHTLVPMPVERSTLLLMKSQRDAGLSYPAIARDLASRGIRTKNGSRYWNARVIRRILIRAAKGRP